MKLSELIETLQGVLESYGDGKVLTLFNKDPQYYRDWIYMGWLFVEREYDDCRQPSIQIRFKPDGNKKEEEK